MMYNKIKKWFKNDYFFAEVDDLTLINILIDRGYLINKCNHKTIIDNDRIVLVKEELKEQVHYSHDLDLNNLTDIFKNVIVQRLVNTLFEKDLVEFQVNNVITPKSKNFIIEGRIKIIKPKK